MQIALSDNITSLFYGTPLTALQHIFLKRIVAGLLEWANWSILAAWFFKEVVGKNSPIRGWVGLSKMSKKVEMSIIELSQLGQDLFDFSDLKWAIH